MIKGSDPSLPFFCLCLVLKEGSPQGIGSDQGKHGAVFHMQGDCTLAVSFGNRFADFLDGAASWADGTFFR